VTGDLRVRHLGDRGGARVEVEQEWIPRLHAQWDAVASRLVAIGFARAQLDPRGYRRGALLETSPAAGD
jgi:uncharacterized protein